MTTRFEKSMIRIVYFQQDGLVTGSAISLRNFLGVLDKERFEAIVILCEDGPVRLLYEELGIKVIVFYYVTFWTFPGPRCLSRENFWQYRSLLPSTRLKSFIESLRPDIIHINDKASINVGISLLKLDIPIVQHLRSSYFITKCKLNTVLHAHLIKKYAAHLIAISEDELDGFERCNNVSIIYNTVEQSNATSSIQRIQSTRNRLNIKDEQVLIGYAAAVIERKGCWDFLELCLRYSESENVKFIMVGAIPNSEKTNLGNNLIINQKPSSYIEDFIKRNSLEEKLIVTGFRKDNLDLIAAMDVLIVPNKNGVLGRQPLEAQALGVPVIAYQGHSQKSSVIIHGKTGFLETSLEDVIERINYILRNPGVMKKMSVNAIKYAEEHFSPMRNMKAIEGLYSKLIS